MKKIIGFIPTWTLFWIGDLVSRSYMFKFGFGYGIYTFCMTKSSEIQDWAGLKSPWKNVEIDNLKN